MNREEKKNKRQRREEGTCVQRERKTNRVRKGREKVGRKERSRASRRAPPLLCSPGLSWGDVWALEFWPKM